MNWKFLAIIVGLLVVAVIGGVFLGASLFKEKAPLQESEAVPESTTVGAPQPPKADIEFIVDSSGSMAALTEGTSQLDIVKKSIGSTIATIPGDVSVALRVYGHRVPQSDKENSCKDSELVIPFAPLDTTAFNAKVSGLSANGYTPIAYSLKEAAKDFLGKESQHVIILLSDGEETCGGDPVAEAKNLISQGFKVIIHTVGFRVDAATRAQLTSISNTTGGLYFDAKDSASLTKTLKEATPKSPADC